MIGVFDSGVGGLSVWREMIQLMPDEKYLYVADSGYCPYGEKPKEYILERACLITEYLLSRGARMIVVACNTATAAAIEYLRSRYPVPFIGMEPAVKPAALNTVSGVIGVLATKGTFGGKLYLRTLHRFAANTTVIEQVGKGLVERVESGAIADSRTNAMLRMYLKPMMMKGADHLVLGCTHYPFLIDAILKIVGDQMIIVNPAPAVAKRVKEVLEEMGQEQEEIVPETVNEFITTGRDMEPLKKIVRSIVPELAGGYIYRSISLED